MKNGSHKEERRAREGHAQYPSSPSPNLRPNPSPSTASAFLIWSSPKSLLLVLLDMWGPLFVSSTPSPASLSLYTFLISFSLPLLSFSLSRSMCIIVGITPASNSEKGGVYIKELVDIKKGFTIGFDFRMATRGADGFAFVVHRYQIFNLAFFIYKNK